MKLPKVAEAQRCVAALDVDKDGIFFKLKYFLLFRNLDFPLNLKVGESQ